MAVELTAVTHAGAQFVALAEELSLELAPHASAHDRDGTFSFVHVDDAAAATVAACERGAQGIYNVCDDEPAHQRDWLPVYAEALGAKPPRRVPVWLVRLVAGSGVAAFATTLRGASNELAKRELAWQPRYASWRQGFAEALG